MKHRFADRCGSDMPPSVHFLPSMRRLFAQSCCLLVLALAAAGATQAQEAVQWQVQKFTGEFRQVPAQDILGTDKELITGAGELALNSAVGQVAIRANSKLRMRREPTAGSEYVQVIELLDGALHYVSYHLAGTQRREAVRIATPTATLGIRGTDFEVLVITPATYERKKMATPDSAAIQPGTYVRVHSGLVAMGGRFVKSPPVLLGAGSTGVAGYPVWTKQDGSASQALQIIQPSDKLNPAFPKGSLDLDLEAPPPSDGSVR